MDEWQQPVHCLLFQRHSKHMHFETAVKQSTRGGSTGHEILGIILRLQCFLQKRQRCLCIWRILRESFRGERHRMTARTHQQDVLVRDIQRFEYSESDPGRHLMTVEISTPCRRSSSTVAFSASSGCDADRQRGMIDERYPPRGPKHPCSRAPSRQTLLAKSVSAP